MFERVGIASLTIAVAMVFATDTAGADVLPNPFPKQSPQLPAKGSDFTCAYVDAEGLTLRQVSRTNVVSNGIRCFLFGDFAATSYGSTYSSPSGNVAGAGSFDSGQLDRNGSFVRSLQGARSTQTDFVAATVSFSDLRLDDITSAIGSGGGGSAPLPRASLPLSLLLLGGTIGLIWWKRGRGT